MNWLNSMSRPNLIMLEQETTLLEGGGHNGPMPPTNIL